MRLFSRPCDENPSVRVWYTDCYFWDGTKRVRRKRSTGVIDDGSAKQKRTAEIAARDIAHSLAIGTGRSLQKTTIASVIDGLIAEMEREGRSPATREIVGRKAERLFEFFGSASDVVEAVTKDSLKAYADSELTKRSPATVGREILTIRHAMRVAGLPVPKGPKLKGSRAVERVVPPEATQRFIAAVQRSRRDHVTVYRLLGIRDSELGKIDPAVDWERNLVHIAGTKTRNSDRFVPMPPAVRAILWARRDRRPMFERWGSMRRDIARAGVRIGIGPVSPNDLRRSFATELASKGVPILHVAALMGTSIKMLERVYARVAQGDHMHRAMAMLAPVAAE